MRTKTTERTCARCGATKALTPEHWHFYRTGPRRGGVTGFCRVCQAAYCRHYDATVVRTGIRLARKYAATLADQRAAS
jgi:coenzyme F420-reducing hydrogenase beta subunit